MAEKSFVPPLQKIAKYVRDLIGEEKVISYGFVTDEKHERCKGCGRFSFNKLFIKTESNEYKVPVDVCCQVDFENELRHFSSMKSLDEKVRKNLRRNKII